MAEEVAYTDQEHEAMLAYIDLVHHETRAQTIARLEAALKVAKASKSDAPSLETHTEAVTREVTDAPPEPKPAEPTATPKVRGRKRKSG